MAEAVICPVDFNRIAPSVSRISSVEIKNPDISCLDLPMYIMLE